MGLTQKILLFTGLLVVALVVTTVAFTSVQADRLANQTIHQALLETRDVWQTFQADRYNKLRLGIRVLGNDPAFKAMVEGTDQATILDTLRERNDELKADFFIVTDANGVVVARTDRPSSQGDDLSTDPLVQKPLDGEEAATVWRQGGRLFHAVSVPMSTGPDLKGVLIAGYGINETLANDIRKLTHSEVAFLTQAPGQPAQLAVSSLGPKEEALRAALPAVPAAADSPFPLDIGGERHVAVLVPLKAATGSTAGSMLALRSLAVEMAAFRKFRTSLLIVAGVVMAIALLLAYLAAARITGPVRRLVGLVERARDGSYAGKVAVGTSDEIGALARSFNHLLTELREKEQMIGFLREGITVLRKGSGVTSDGTGATPDPASAATRNVRGGTTSLDRGAVVAGRYEVLESIGKGGMGVVFRARDRQLDEVVALKVLRDDALSEDESLLGRFKQELKLARRITHRNVLRTHDFGESDGTAYISMEYLEGVTLKDLIRSKGALPLSVGLRVAKHMCQGLEAAHAEGVVHRDVKPQNMLILPETGELKIMDFGIARVSEVEGGLAGLTTDGSVLGTPDYMPPEQASGGQADFRSDIYSLGVVLFEVFTGHLPFPGEKIVQVILGHLQKQPPAPRSLNPQLPPDLEAVILRCLEKKPAARYQRVGDVLRDLNAVSSRIEAAA
jgi:HAMP domain-containing protein/predicted Ser/Thr protein kinase